MSQIKVIGYTVEGRSLPMDPSEFFGKMSKISSEVNTIKLQKSHVLHLLENIGTEAISSFSLQVQNQSLNFLCSLHVKEKG